MRRAGCRWVTIAGLALAGVTVALPALAQTQTQKPPAQTPTTKPPAPPQTKKPKGPPKWQVEVHFGAMLADSPGGGSSIDAFPVGTTFATVNTDIASTTRSIQSWYFGDGNVLFNEVRARFAAQFNRQIPAVVPIDDVLRTASVHRKTSPGFGFRFSRQLTPKIAAEFSLDRNSVRLELNDAGAAALETSRLSFLDAFNGMLAIIPQTGGSVTATTTLRDDDGSQTIVAGALVFNLWRSGKLAAHGVAGAGMIASTQPTLFLEQRGGYRFNWGGTASVINETDFVSINLTDSEQTFVGVFGGGITYDFGPKHGLRTDVRILAGKNGLRTIVDAVPFAATSTSPEPIATQTNPGIQFSNQTGVKSSLSDTTMRDFETFSGGGVGARVQLGIGYFFKF
jgi:hypothetical protein